MKMPDYNAAQRIIYNAKKIRGSREVNARLFNDIVLQVFFSSSSLILHRFAYLKKTH